MNDSNTRSLWNMIIIEDPEGLPGKTLNNVLDLIQSIVCFKYVILNDINGAFVAPLVKQEGKIIEFQKISKIIKEVKQFDWGDFFLFKKYPDHWEKITKYFEYPEYILKSDTTVRAIDDTYVYIYTPYNEVVGLLQNHFIIETTKTDLLENLEYPY